MDVHRDAVSQVRPAFPGWWDFEVKLWCLAKCGITVPVQELY